jgi:hypothetical protein
VQRKASLAISFLFLVLSLLFLSLPFGEESNTSEKKPLASIDLLQSKSKNPQLVRQAGTLTRSWSALIFAAQMSGWQGSLNGDISGVRTYKEQKELHRDFLRGVSPAAFHPDGPSRHILKNINKKGQWSQAVDVSRPRELIRVAADFGVELYQPYKDEPWHIEARKPFKLSGFFPASQEKEKGERAREPITSLTLLALVLLLLGLFRFALLFEAKKSEERPLLLLAQGLLLCAFPLLFWNILSFANTISFITLFLSSLALALLLLLPGKSR